MSGPSPLGGAPEGSYMQPITIDDDMDVPHSEVGVRAQDLLERAHSRGALLAARLVKIEEDDEALSEEPWAEEEANYDKEIEAIEAADLAEDDPAPEPEPKAVRVSAGPGHCRHWKKGIRNPCRCGTHYLPTHASTPDVEFKVTQFVELKEPVEVGRYLAEFLEVCQIGYPKKPPREKGAGAFVRGLPYARTRNLEGRIHPRKNEVCALVEMDSNDDRSIVEQALAEVPLTSIKAVRVLHKTNKTFPECRFDPVIYKTKEDRETRAPLTCRWVMTRTYPDARYRRRGRAVDGEELRHYDESDVTKDRHRASDPDRLTRWRRNQEKVPGGSYIPESTHTAKAEPVTKAGSGTRTETETTTLPGQKYSAVDFFCGAGGFSKGAEMAGFKILTACDHWPRCCETYRENFPGAELHEMDAHDFIQKNGGIGTDLTIEPPAPVDFVHMSPPCQFYSPAHTCPGRNDTANIATLFACEYIIFVFRPRLFTVEQTFGLAQDRHLSYLNAFIQGFTSQGYSVKWRVFRLVEFGLPQTRRRLFMMGAAPGEKLPGWPVPTHSSTPTGSQRPLVSAAQACRPLIPGVNHHDVQGARAIDRPPWDGDRPLERTITTSGGQCYHWSGKRDLTLAEFAALQGFPRDFRFRSTYIKKQIGNAFPPIVVKAIMKQIRKHLEEVDGIQRLPEPGSVIDLGDDDDDDYKPVDLLKHEDVSYQEILGSYDEKEATVPATRKSMTKAQSQPRRSSRRSSGLHLKDIRSLSIKDDDRKTAVTATQTRRAGPTTQNAGRPGPAHRRRSSADDSITYVGESTRPGSSRHLPVIIEDCGDNTETQADAAGSQSSGPAPRNSSNRSAILWMHSLTPYNNPLMQTWPHLTRRKTVSVSVSARAGGSAGSGSDRAKTAGAPASAPGSRRRTALMEQQPGKRDSVLWRDFVGDLNENTAADIAIATSRQDTRHCLGGGQATTNPVDDMPPHGACVVDDELLPHMAMSLSLDGQGQEAEGPRGGDRKEVVRKFEQYDDGQDNESPRDTQGRSKRPRIG